jgi:hypothetical protein
VAPKAGKDVLRHPSGDRPSLCLQEVEDGGLRVSKALGGGVQQRERGISAGLLRRRLPSTTSGSSSCAGGVVVLATSATSGAAASGTSAASGAAASAAAAGSAGGGSAMASSAAAAAGASIIAAGPAVSSWGTASGLGGVAASGSGPLGLAATGAGAGGAPAGVVADLPAGEDEGTGWGPDPPAGAMPAVVLDASEEWACHITNMVRAPEDKWRNEKFQRDHLHETVPLPTTLGDWRDLFSRRGPSGPLVEVPGCWRRGWGLRPRLRRRWWCRWALRRRWRWRYLLLRRRPPRLLRSPLWLLVLRRRWWSSARPLRLRRLLAFGGRLPDKGAVAALEPPGPGPLRLAAPRGCRPLRLVVPPGLGPPGPWLARCWRSGEAPGMWIPRLGSPPSCRTARPPSSRVGIDARTVDHSAWSSHRALILLGRTRDSRLNASPVIAQSDASSSALEKSVPGPVRSCSSH